jgi:FtsP/CotA-like multicopper oxidase with cupredoxin domain
VNNLDEGTHPFHLHGHKFWVLAQGDGVYQSSTPLAPNPVFRDTVSVRILPLTRDLITEGYGFTLIRFIADNPGAWAFHCHIIWHMEAGLLITFLSEAGKLSGMVSGAPDEWRKLCTR